MEWTTFLGALLGAAIGVLISVGVIGVWVIIDERRIKQRQMQERRLTLESILERHLEQYLVEHFEILFPGWKIFDDASKKAVISTNGHRPTGIRYRTDAGEIDLLSIDPQGNFVVIELKADRAPDQVVSQVDRYIAWVKGHLAKPGQRVTGLIIAKSFSRILAYSLSDKRGIRIWTYNWQLRFNKRPDWKGGAVDLGKQVASEQAASDIAIIHTAEDGSTATDLAGQEDLPVETLEGQGVTPTKD